MKMPNKLGSGLLKILVPAIIGTGSVLTQESQQKFRLGAYYTSDSGAYYEYMKGEEGLDWYVKKPGSDIFEKATAPKNRRRIWGEGEKLVRSIEEAEAEGEKPKMRGLTSQKSSDEEDAPSKLTLAEGLRSSLTQSWSGYLDYDVRLYEGLRDGFKSLEKNTESDKLKYRAIVSDLESLRGSLEDVVRDPVAYGMNVTIRGDVALEAARDAQKYLESLHDTWESDLETTEKGLDLYRESIESDSTFSRKARNKLRAKERELQTRTGHLRKLVNFTDILSVYIEDNFTESRGFEEPETFNFNPDDNYKAMFRFLDGMYREAEKKLNDDPFKEWHRNVYAPAMFSARNQVREIRRDSVNPKRLARTVKKYHLGNGVVEEVKRERERLSEIEDHFDNLAKGVVPAKKRRGTRAARRKRGRTVKMPTLSLPKIRSGDINGYTVGFGTDGDAYAISVGTRFGHFGLVGRYGEVNDEVVKDITSDPINGRYFSGTETNTDIDMFGVAAELYVWRLIAGAGANKYKFSTEGVERIMSQTRGEISRNTYSRSNSELSWTAYGGVRALMSKKGSSIDVLGVYDSRTGWRPEVRLSLAVGNKGNGKKTRGGRR